MKTNLHRQKGFTLVELAIVMTIIGLLIGGILKGQELMQNARVTSTISQVRAYEAATTTFRDKYDSVPGDMVNATTRIPGCPATNECNPAQAAPIVAGDGSIGNPGWGTAGFPAQSAAVQGGNESMLFWTHLLLSDLISGVTNAHVTAATAPSWGETHPGAKVGGGFVVGFGDGTPAPNSGAAANTGPSGMVLALVGGPIGAAAVPGGGGIGTEPMTPTRAAQIDRKMDDGRPDGGYVHAWSNTVPGVAGCVSVAPATYNESLTSQQCGLFFRIQG